MLLEWTTEVAIMMMTGHQLRIVILLAGGMLHLIHSFAATQLIHLTRGNTAYKIIESEGLIDDRGNMMDPHHHRVPPWPHGLILHLGRHCGSFVKQRCWSLRSSCCL